MISFAVFVFGLAMGSFLNSVIYRLEVQQGLRQISDDRRKTGVTIMRGRSFCPHCNHNLAWYDLIPLLSFVVLKGRCKYCKDKISFQYPLVELATGLVFLLIFWHLSLRIDWPLVHLAYLWAMAMLLIAIFVYDLKHFLIPDMLVYVATGLAVLWRIFEFLDFDILNLFRISDFGFRISLPLVQSVLAGIGAAVFFLVIYLVSKGRWMGLGDVKLAFLLGLFLGWPSILVALFLAFFLGAVVGVALIALKKKGLKSEVPFAPFLIIGTAIAFFFGSQILHWYLGLFLV